jgi:hypothetical protein
VQSGSALWGNLPRLDKNGRSGAADVTIFVIFYDFLVIRDIFVMIFQSGSALWGLTTWRFRLKTRQNRDFYDVWVICTSPNHHVCFLPHVLFLSLSEF